MKPVLPEGGRLSINSNSFETVTQLSTSSSKALLRCSGDTARRIPRCEIHTVCPPSRPTRVLVRRVVVKDVAASRERATAWTNFTKFGSPQSLRLASLDKSLSRHHSQLKTIFRKASFQSPPWRSICPICQGAALASESKVHP